VDAPNLHLVTEKLGQCEKSEYLGSKKAVIDKSRCIGCGLCQAKCRFHAINSKGDTYEVNLMACEGCGVCQYLCPENAVSMEDDVAGDLYLYQGERMFSTASLRMGRGNSGKLVTEVKKPLMNGSIETELAIIDGSPGIGCPVIASVNGMDMVLIVAEPSLSGISDMKRVIKTADILGTKAVVCVNKSDICPENTQEIKHFCKEHKIPFMGTIPYDDKVSQAINHGVSIAQVDCPAKDALQDIYHNILKEFKED
jgi:MinD superfamily P-loop ATPase